jgi:hypothetical protein
MPLAPYSRIRLVTDVYESEGVSVGAIGYIIEVYNDAAYEIEFSDDNGLTVAQVVVKQHEVERAELNHSLD